MKSTIRLVSYWNVLLENINISDFLIFESKLFFSFMDGERIYPEFAPVIAINALHQTNSSF